MRIVIDLDGVICEIKRDNQSYADVKPIPGAVQSIKKLRTNGHYIIISSARHMNTCNGNVGRVVQKIAQVTLNWLEKKNVEFDEIYFGKPNAEIYIDDRAVRFTGWNSINENFLSKNSKDR